MRDLDARLKLRRLCMKIPYLLLGLLAATVSIAGHTTEKVYKWKDANGIVHFSDAPPPLGTTFENVRVVGQNTPVTSSAADPATAATDAQNNSDKTAAVPGAEKIRRCKDAQDRMALLSGSSPLTTMEDGKTVALDGPRRAAELNIAKATVQSLCPTGPEVR